MMDRERTLLFVRRWLTYTIHDAFAQTFGWLSLLGASCGGFIAAKFGIHAASDPFKSNLIGAASGFVIGLGIYSTAAFFKARRYMRPIIVAVADGVLSYGSTFNDQFRSYNVSAIVRNRSEVPLNDCRAYVMNAPRHDGSVGARLIESFDMPPKSEKAVGVAFWTWREPPYSDDNDIGLAGPPGNGWDGNVCRVPGAETRLHIRIVPHGRDCMDVHCRIWIDTTARKLRVEPLPD